MPTSGETAEELGSTGPGGAILSQLRRTRADALWQLGVGVAALVFLRLYPFSSNSRFSVCGFHWLTGHPCPLCGMTRALSCLTKGDWIGAVSFNLLSPAVFGMLLITTGFAAIQVFSPEFFLPADFGFRCGRWWTICLALFAVYGVLRIVFLVP